MSAVHNYSSTSVFRKSWLVTTNLDWSQIDDMVLFVIVRRCTRAARKMSHHGRDGGWSRRWEPYKTRTLIIFRRPSRCLFGSLRGKFRWYITMVSWYVWAHVRHHELRSNVFCMQTTETKQASLHILQVTGNRRCVNVHQGNFLLLRFFRVDFHQSICLILICFASRSPVEESIQSNHTREESNHEHGCQWK